MERMKMKIVAGAMVAGLALAVLPLAGCGPRGRVKDDNEGDLVGSRKAGAETYNRLVNETTKKLLGDIERKPAPGKALRAICLAVLCGIGVSAFVNSLLQAFIP